MDDGYLKTGIKAECFGCESCLQVCLKSAISMQEDHEGFRYPIIDAEKCVHCGLCNQACPKENMPIRYKDNKYVFGGYILDKKIRNESTSGGAFSAIVDSWCKNNYVIFGAATDGLDIYHTSITDKAELGLLRRSKYSQSNISGTYSSAKKSLIEGKSVLYSGTPCQIAGLKSFLWNTDQSRLLTVEVICEGVPSPWYVRKFSDYCKKKYGSPIEEIDYRYKDVNKWDFEVMAYTVGGKQKKMDRWFNPFWSIWLNHLMSRPSCYKCPFANTERTADISLGDLWGVHLYCPELYGKNTGSSLIIVNTEKGKEAVKSAEKLMYGHELEFTSALRYQSPMRKHIDGNLNREEFMQDLTGDMDYEQLNKKWSSKPSFKMLWQKYIWGNRQKVALWNVLNKEK